MTTNMTTKKHVLVVGGDREVYDRLANSSTSPRWAPERAINAEEALAKIRAGVPEIVVADLDAPGADAAELLRSIHETRSDAKVIVVASESTPDSVVEAMREHAFAYFCRPFDPDSLGEMIDRALTLPGWQDGIEVLSSRPEWIALRLRCQTLTADRLLQFLREMDIGLTPGEHEDMAQAFREMLLNAIEHGGQFDPKKKVHIECIRTSRILIYHLRDPGKGFSFDFLPHAAISNPPGLPAAHMEYRAAQDLRPGGFGILLTRSLVDELLYNETGNEVLLIKYLGDGVKG